MSNIIQQIENSNCSKCQDLCLQRSRIVVSKGNMDADVVIVGQNPGGMEDKRGLPFCGPAGLLLDSIIRDAGFNPLKDFFFTNVVLCHTESNLEPRLRHIQNCSDNLRSLTSKFSNYIAIGRVAAEGLSYTWSPQLYTQVKMQVGMKSLITSGSPYTMENGKALFCTYHTAYLLRCGINSDNKNNVLYQTIVDEIKAVKYRASHKPSTNQSLAREGLF